MEREYKTFSSFAESDEADRKYYLSLTAMQRMEILFELIEQYQGNEASKGLERVYRIRRLHDNEEEIPELVIEKGIRRRLNPQPRQPRIISTFHLQICTLG